MARTVLPTELKSQWWFKYVTAGGPKAYFIPSAGINILNSIKCQFSAHANSANRGKDVLFGCIVGDCMLHEEDIFAFEVLYLRIDLLISC